MSRTTYLIIGVIAIILGSIFNYSMLDDSTKSSGARSYGGGAVFGGVGGSGGSSGGHK